MVIEIYHILDAVMEFDVLSSKIVWYIIFNFLSRCCDHYRPLVMQFEKNTFVFFKKNCFLWRKKHDLRKKHWKSVFFCFFHNKLCIKEKTKVVLLIWGPGDPVCPREVKITPPTPSCSPLCGSVCGNWPNWGLLCKLVAKTFFFLCLYDVCC